MGGRGEGAGAFSHRPNYLYLCVVIVVVFGMLHGVNNGGWVDLERRLSCFIAQGVPLI